MGEDLCLVPQVCIPAQQQAGGRWATRQHVQRFQQCRDPHLVQQLPTPCAQAPAARPLQAAPQGGRKWAGRVTLRAETCSGGRTQAHMGTVVRLWDLGHMPESTVSTAEKQPEAWTPSCQPQAWGAPGLGLLPVTSPDTSSYLLPRFCPCPLASPHIPLPTVPLPRTTSWRRSHQVPSVS